MGRSRSERKGSKHGDHAAVAPGSHGGSTPGDQPGFSGEDGMRGPLISPAQCSYSELVGMFAKLTQGGPPATEPGTAVPLSGAFPLSGRVAQLPVLPLILRHLRSIKQTLRASLPVGQPSKTQGLSPTTDACGNT